MGFLTVNQGLKLVRGGKDTYLRIEYTDAVRRAGNCIGRGCGTSGAASVLSRS